jgi:hypothetical protein
VQFAITGTIDVGTQQGEVSGSILYDAGDSSQTFSITVAGVNSTNATIHVGSMRYAKAGDGPWLVDASPVKRTSPGLSDFLTKLSGLVDKGPEQHDGAATHRLELPAGTVVDPAMFGLSNPSMTSPTAAIVFYATADGRPVAIDVEAAWTQAAGGQSIPVKMSLDLAFVQIGGNVMVSAPDDVWQPFHSKRYHYSIAHPGDWDVSVESQGADVFTSPQAPYLVATRFPSHGYSLSVITKATILAAKVKDHAANVANVAFSLAGSPARLLTYHATLGGTRYVLYEVLCVKAGYVYDAAWFSPRGNDVNDLATFEEMLSTFAFA